MREIHIKIKNNLSKKKHKIIKHLEVNKKVNFKNRLISENLEDRIQKDKKKKAKRAIIIKMRKNLHLKLFEPLNSPEFQEKY